MLQALWAAVVFMSGAPNWDYAIRMNYTDVPWTTPAVNTLQRGTDDSNQHQYFYSDAPTKHKTLLPG